MSAAATPRQAESYVAIVAQQLRADWPHLQDARTRAMEKLHELTEILRGETSPDVSFVVHGSLARMEFTAGSDLDWTLLVDGQANPQHQIDMLRIRKKLELAGNRPPGKEGTFGILTFSHPIIHMIGGEDDSNANTTRRILLLLEASTVGDHRQAFEGVRKNILHRYLTEDHGLARQIGTEDPRRIPLFLLNDIARYWRTMTVDFAYKQHDRGSDGYALRSLKLGISRKLTYASGLTACFWCDPSICKHSQSESYSLQKIIANLDDMISLTPLERMARFFYAYWNHEGMQTAAKAFFGAYDEFLALLNDQEKRKLLTELKVDDMYDDNLFGHARAIRMRFKDAIRMTFLEPSSPLYRHIISMGVF